MFVGRDHNYCGESVRLLGYSHNLLHGVADHHHLCEALHPCEVLSLALIRLPSLAKTKPVPLVTGFVYYV
jgi:hypothetical protein